MLDTFMTEKPPKTEKDILPSYYTSKKLKIIETWKISTNSFLVKSQPKTASVLFKKSWLEVLTDASRSNKHLCTFGHKTIQR